MVTDLANAILLDPGGFSNQGFAWRWEIPPELRFRASVNILEHLATIISPWVDMIAGRLNRGDCSLSMGDNTTSAGWIPKSNFNEFTYPEEPIQTEVSCIMCHHHATMFMERGIKEYSQWFEGQKNQVADSLSRDFDRSDDELTEVLRTILPSQVPLDFKIVPLPNEIVSWLT
jgi:hypothetical protein